MSNPRNPRGELAEKLADRILLDAIGSAASSGLLLTRPEDVEGALFISDNLQAALNGRGAFVLYASLDEASSADSIISSVVCEAIQHLAVRCQSGEGPVANGVVDAAAAFPEELVGIGREVSLCSAFVRLSELAGRVIVLIIDNVQRAQDTAEGKATLYALKAARDEMNSSKHRGLRVVLVGADEGHLRMLCSENDQAFFATPMMNLPR